MLWECLECTTRYACDLQACPNCGSAERLEDGMAKISVHGGPSEARDVPAADEAEAVVEVEAADEGSEQPSPGTSSSVSTPKTASTSAKSVKRPSRARTTASRSSQGREENSSASSTGTSGPVTGGDDDGD